MMQPVLPMNNQLTTMNDELTTQAIDLSMPSCYLPKKPSTNHTNQSHSGYAPIDQFSIM